MEVQQQSLDLPGHDIPTSDIVTGYAEATGQSQDEAAQSLLYRGGEVRVYARDVDFGVFFTPGHIFRGKQGPRKARVMMLLSHPSSEDTMNQRMCSDNAGFEFLEACAESGIDPSHWYMTSAVKFTYPGGKTSPLVGWKDDCRWFFERELEIVQPEWIIAAGTHSLKFLYGNKAKISDVRGQILNYKGCKVFAIYAPSSVIADSANQPDFRKDIKDVATLLKEGSFPECPPTEVELLDTEEKLRAWAVEAKTKPVLSVDCEWGGRSPQQGGLRTIQITWKPGYCAVVHVRNERMEPVVSEAVIGEVLRDVLCRDDLKIVGHFFRSDLLWLRHIGVDCLEPFLRGMDTILAYHALYPNDDQGLEMVSNRLLGPDRYDAPLNTWKEQNNKVVEQFGYSYVPDTILIPYGARDADKTLRIAIILAGLLNRPGNEGLKRLVYQGTMPANSGIAMMESEGLLIDMDRFAWFEHVYKEKHAALLQQVRDAFNWPDFNPASWQQKNDLLYGSWANGKKKDAFGVSPQLRPEGVECLGLTPVKTTGKPSSMWTDVAANGEEKKYTPSSDNETLGILAEECKILAILRDERYLGKAVGNFMPDKKKGVRGELYQKSGVRRWRDPDGYLRTHISQGAETGRWKSFDPNAQNFPSRREADFKRIFEDTSFPPFKSIFVGDVDMPFVLEADYEAAEVHGLSMLSGDLDMRHLIVTPGRDIHSEMAVKAFGLHYNSDCGVKVKKWMGGQESPQDGVIKHMVEYPENKGGEIWIGNYKVDVWPGHKPVGTLNTPVKRGQLVTTSYKSQRVGAKTIIFGVPYQRGARAVGREIEKLGVSCTPERAQELLDTYHEMFPKVQPFLDFCKRSVHDPGYMDSVWGRRRFFYRVISPSAMAGQERESCNWSVQNVVAEAINKATANAYRALATSKYPYRIKLAVHDSLIFTCAGDAVPYMCEELIPQVMCTDVVVPTLNFSFGVEVSPYLRWTEHVMQEELEAAGWPKGYKIVG